MNNRSAEKEKLDNLSLNGEPLHKALKSLAWVNRWLGNHSSTIKAIHNICKKENKPLKIIDLGCGGGDLILAVAKFLQKKGIAFSIIGIDGNSNTIEYAAEKCSGFPEISFQQADILAPEFKLNECDILMSSHFVYHFSEKELADFINKNLSATTVCFIFSELERSRLAYLLFKYFSFFMPLSRLAKQDGLRAIKRSFTKKEWLSVLNQAGVSVFSLRRIIFFRLQVIIYPGKKP